MEIINLAGSWVCSIPGQEKEMRLPGTLDENEIGFPDQGSNQWHPDGGANEALMADQSVIATRYTRRFTYEGPAQIRRRIHVPLTEEERLFLEVERARSLSLRVNGQPVPDFVPPSLATMRVFEVTGLLTGDDEIEWVSDNSYPGWPREDIVYSSAATDETQTNWNGLLGKVRLRKERMRFFQSLRVYPHEDTLTVVAEVSATQPWMQELRVECDALETPARREAEGNPGCTEIRFEGLRLKKEVKRWDEGEGNLYSLTVSGEGMDSLTVSFGIRDFRAKDGFLTLNGHRIFLRSEANCAVFPETGYPPMEKASWRTILETYRSYGVNCMRFHSHIPPEAAFAAADEMGMMMQPELCHWNPRNAFEAEESYAYYRQELEQTLRMLANHPSFVMLTFGNELHTGEIGMARMHEMLRSARRWDDTRLYANGSNVFYGAKGGDPESDFYTSSKYGNGELRAIHAGMEGPLNHRYPGADLTYDEAMEEGRKDWKKPVFSFEVGQYEVLPDFEELEMFHGVTLPENLKLIQRKMKAAGLEPEWKRRVEATGELSLLGYRAEVEAAMLTRELSGISLLGLQDFPGQGTALVGMLNSHLQPKPYAFARPERFAAFFRESLPIPRLPRYTWEAGEVIQAPLTLVNYGKQALKGIPSVTVGTGRAQLPEIVAPGGGLTEAGEFTLPLPEVSAPQRLELRAEFAGLQHTYPLWVYPRTLPARPATVYETRALDAQAESVLAAGGIVYLSPDSTAEAIPHSIQAQFSTDFWSVGTFPFQEGGMGQLIDAEHPLFRLFPTTFYSEWQWWPMANQRAMILPEPLKCIVTEMDSYAFLRPMAKLFECRCGGGRLLVSSFNLHHLQQYPEARALQHAIYTYLASEDFQPSQTLSLSWVKSIFES